MDKKQVLKYLIVGGAAVAIISVFLPFVSALGFSTSMWDGRESSSEVYILMAFSVLAIVLPLINKKQELVYMSSGSLLTISLIYTIQGIDSKMFSSFSIGYYLLVLSAIVVTGANYLYLNYDEVLSKRKNVGYAPQQPMNNGFNQPQMQPQQPMNNGFNQPQMQPQQPMNNGFNQPQMQPQQPMNNNINNSNFN